MLRRRKILILAELQAEIDGWNSDEEANDVDHRADEINVVITKTPPEKVDAISDNEEIDGNIQLLKSNPQPNNYLFWLYLFLIVYMRTFWAKNLTILCIHEPIEIEMYLKKLALTSLDYITHCKKCQLP